MAEGKSMSTRDAGRVTAYDMEDWWGDEQDAKKAGSRQQRPRHRVQHLPPTVKELSPRARAARRKAQSTGRMLMYMTFAVLAACLFIQVNRYAQIASQTKRISALVSEISDMEADRANLELRLGAQERVKRVQQLAMYELGMTYPAAGQVRVVALNGLTTDQQTQTAAISADLAQ